MYDLESFVKGFCKQVVKKSETISFQITQLPTENNKAQFSI
jgi:hypothetical protein